MPRRGGARAARRARRSCRSRSGASTGSGASAGRSPAANLVRACAVAGTTTSAFGLPLHVAPDADLRAATHELGVALTAPARGAPAPPAPPSAAGRARAVVPRPPRRSRARPSRGARPRQRARGPRCARRGALAIRLSRDGQHTEATAGGGVRRHPPRRRDPAQQALAAGDQRRAVDPARRRARPRRGPARRGDPRDPRGDRARRRPSATWPGSTPPTCRRCGAAAAG